MLHSLNFINPLQLTFLVTNTCTAECGHCSVGSSPTRRGSLTSEQMIRSVDEFLQKHKLRVVIFAGGEPTLLGKALLETISYIDMHGIITRLVTNAHWATSIKSARAKLIELREAGLRELNISCDDFHTPYISIEHVKNAWQASKGIGFDAVVIASASGPDSKLTPNRIMQILGEEIQCYYDDDGAPSDLQSHSLKEVRIISNSSLSRLGRGVDRIPNTSLRFPRRQSDLDMPCRWIGSSPAISPRNTLLSCCGMEANGRKHLDYGDLAKNSVLDLLSRAEKDTVVAAISVLGPYKIMKFLQAVEPSSKFWAMYAGVCELCAHIFARPEIVELLSAHLDALEILVAVAQKNAQERAGPLLNIDISLTDKEVHNGAI